MALVRHGGVSLSLSLTLQPFADTSHLSDRTEAHKAGTEKGH